MNSTDYTKQAQDFLDKFGIKFRATLSDSKPCPWAMAEKPFKTEPHHYRVTLSKPRIHSNNKLKHRIVFDFFGSIADAEAGKDPTAYDVLACISSDVHCPDTFKDFCGEYGYEQDSIKSLQQFRRCDRFGKRLRDFFTEAEIEALSEIR